MKTELRLRRHSILAGHNIVELWHNGQFVGEVTGSDACGVRVISKYPLSYTVTKRLPANVAEVLITPENA